MEAKSKLTYTKMAAYLAAFFLIWTLREFFVRREAAQMLGAWPAALLGVVAKLLIWTLPALLLERHYHTEMAVPALFGQPIRWERVLLCAAGLVAYNLLASLLSNGGIRVHPQFQPVDLLGTVLFVGITEEMVFRGFLLNALLGRMEEKWALVISSALFVCIHFPIWYTSGLFATPVMLLRSCLTIFALGLLFGYSFCREKNLAVPILLHMAWNCAALVLFG